MPLSDTNDYDRVRAKDLTLCDLKRMLDSHRTNPSTIPHRHACRAPCGASYYDPLYHSTRRNHARPYHPPFSSDLNARTSRSWPYVLCRPDVLGNASAVRLCSVAGVRLQAVLSRRDDDAITASDTAIASDEPWPVR